MDSERRSRSAAVRAGASVEISEQPAGAYRFRYQTEMKRTEDEPHGPTRDQTSPTAFTLEERAVGILPGASSTGDHKTFPTIQIDGYCGPLRVVVSCVSTEWPHRPHPHSIVGQNCQEGVCVVQMETTKSSTSLAFQGLGIKCAKRSEILQALATRQGLGVDPFTAGFTSQEPIDLKQVRLAFQVQVRTSPGQGWQWLPPIISDIIHDQKTLGKGHIEIKVLSHSSCYVTGHKKMVLVCSRLPAGQIAVRFYLERDAHVEWEAFADFAPQSDVHHRVAIALRTPAYKDVNIENKVGVKIQLVLTQKGKATTSEPFSFTYWPINQVLPSTPGVQVLPGPSIFASSAWTSHPSEVTAAVAIGQQQPLQQPHAQLGAPQSAGSARAADTRGQNDPNISPRCAGQRPPVYNQYSAHNYNFTPHPQLHFPYSPSYFPSFPEYHHPITSGMEPRQCYTAPTSVPSSCGVYGGALEHAQLELSTRDLAQHLDHNPDFVIENLSDQLMNSATLEDISSDQQYV